MADPRRGYRQLRYPRPLHAFHPRDAARENQVVQNLRALAIDIFIDAMRELPLFGNPEAYVVRGRRREYGLAIPLRRGFEDPQVVPLGESVQRARKVQHAL